jgi:hypothetical protein
MVTDPTSGVLGFCSASLWLPVAGLPVAGLPVAGLPVAGLPVAGLPVAELGSSITPASALVLDPPPSTATTN